MRRIEEQYPADIAVIGVHSGKYIAERETLRIRDAALRFRIEHPIVNDRQFRIWRAYAVRAWPTLVVIDRSGYVVGAHAGEFTAEMLQPLLKALVSMSGPADTAKGTLRVGPDTPGTEPGLLRFPEKVAVDSGRIAISDTGNRRVLTGRLESSYRMILDREITRVSADDSEHHELVSPQGLAFDSNSLYVADSETHTVFVIDFRTGLANVVAGTGHQLRSTATENPGALSSPWDLAVVGRTLFVAMAGVHQLWAIDLESGTSRVHCGTGGEDIADGPLADALLAQPMGLTTDGKKLFFADAESSAIRWADIDSRGNVGTIVGTGLFDFGDVDGVGENVRMQHQQGVTLHKGELFVADSYNNAIKRLDVQTRTATTFVRGLHEPGGIASADGHLYVADTNAHKIVVVDFATRETHELEISS
ncbi:MAG: alkyl hydroperoxide reductase [Gemmatimonadaceae bacterium]